MKYDIAFVILTWNSAAYIERCVDSLEKGFSQLHIQACVVDNGSSDQTVEILRRKQQFCQRISLDIVSLKDNLGTTISRNIGINKVRENTRFICVLDSDTEVSETAFLDMIDVLENNPHIGVIGPRLESPDGSIQNSGRAVPTLTVKLLKVLPFAAFRKKGEAMEQVILSPNGLTRVGYLMSACWLFPKHIVDDVGLLDENIFYAPEDVEYCLRIWTHGYAVVYDSRVAILHIWQRLSRKRLLSKHNWEHIKGLLYLFSKYKFCFRRKKFDILMSKGVSK